VHGAKVKVPTVEGAVMLTVAPGSARARRCGSKGQGLYPQGWHRGDQLVTLEVQLPEGDADLVKRLEGWRDSRNLRARLGV
jgi:DnaJ-class molecular chaperone